MIFKKDEYYYSQVFKVPIKIVEYIPGKTFKTVPPHVGNIRYYAYFYGKPCLYTRYDSGFVKNWEPKKITKEEFDLYVALSCFRNPKHEYLPELYGL